MYYVITVKCKVPMRENETMTDLYAIRAEFMAFCIEWGGGIYYSPILSKVLQNMLKYVILVA